MVYMILCLVTLAAYISAADDQLKQVHYLQAVKIYTDAFGDLQNIYHIPQDATRDAARKKVTDTRTHLIVLANQCLANESPEAAAETMHLVGLLDFSLYEDQKEGGFVTSPRVKNTWTKIRKKRTEKAPEVIDEYQESLRIYKSFFGEEKDVNYSPRGAIEVKRVIDDQKTKLLELACDAVIKQKKDEARKIMKLIGYMTCSKDSGQALVSPRVVKVWAKILSKEDLDQPSCSSI